MDRRSIVPIIGVLGVTATAIVGPFVHDAQWDLVDAGIGVLTIVAEIVALLWLWSRDRKELRGGRP